LLLSTILFSFAGFAFLLVFGDSLARAGDAWVWAACALMIFLTACQKSLSDWLIALREIGASQFAFYFVNRFSSVVILIAAVLAGTAFHSAKPFIFVYAAGLALAVLYAIRHVFGHFSWRETLGRFAPSGPLLRNGISCGLQNAGFIALNLSPFVLLGALSNTSEVGLFGVSQRFAALIVLALTTISQLAMRDFAHASGTRDFASLARTLTLSVRLTFVTAVGITIPLVAYAPLWVSVFGIAFAPAAPILALLSAGICAQCLGMPFQSALLATNHELAARNVTLVCAAAGIALNALLIPRWGAEGAAVGTGIGLALQSLGHAARVVKLLAVRFDVARLRIVPGLAVSGAL
jgi:O-antigen/teichoic acid export membrane protein